MTKSNWFLLISISLVAAALASITLPTAFKNERKDFLDYCKNRSELSLANYHTVHELLTLAESTDCDVAFNRLNGQNELNLSGHKIASLDPLRGFTGPKKLVLMNNSIENLDALAGLVQLEELYLAFNRIESLNSLNKMNIQILIASNNPLRRVDGLRNLPNIRLMDISEAELTELPDVSKMTNLVELLAENNHIESTDLKAFRSANLKRLVLNRNKLLDLTFVKGLPRLQELSVNENKLTALSSLSPAIELQALSLRDNHISDLSPLFRLPNLIVVDAKKNDVKKFDVTILYEGKLRAIDLRHNKIEGVECKDKPLSVLCKSVII